MNSYCRHNSSLRIRQKNSILLSQNLMTTFQLFVILSNLYLQLSFKCLYLGKSRILQFLFFLKIELKLYLNFICLTHFNSLSINSKRMLSPHNQVNFFNLLFSLILSIFPQSINHPLDKFQFIWKNHYLNIDKSSQLNLFLDVMKEIAEFIANSLKNQTIWNNLALLSH